jgi:hypothetical protein
MKGGVHHVFMLIKRKVKRKAKEVSIFCPRTKCQQVSSSYASLRRSEETFRNNGICTSEVRLAYRHTAWHLDAQSCNSVPTSWKRKWLDMCTCIYIYIPEPIISAQGHGCESKWPFDASHNKPMIRKLPSCLLRQRDRERQDQSKAK